jgi:hypothetical protein
MPTEQDLIRHLAAGDFPTIGEAEAAALPGIPHGAGRRLQITVSNEEAAEIREFRDAGGHASDTAACAALIRLGLDRLGRPALLYSARAALDRVGAPHESPEGAPVSESWRVRWLAEEVERLRAAPVLPLLPAQVAGLREMARALAENPDATAELHLTRDQVTAFAASESDR